MSQLELTEEQRRSLEAGHGCLQGDGYILMSMEVFRQTMGVGDDDELAASLKAIAEGQADVAAGRTKPFRDVLASLGNGDAV